MLKLTLLSKMKFNKTLRINKVSHLRTSLSLISLFKHGLIAQKNYLICSQLLQHSKINLGSQNINLASCCSIKEEQGQQLSIPSSLHPSAENSNNNSPYINHCNSLNLNLSSAQFQLKTSSTVTVISSIAAATAEDTTMFPPLFQSVSLSLSPLSLLELSLSLCNLLFFSFPSPSSLLHVDSKFIYLFCHAPRQGYNSRHADY